MSRLFDELKRRNVFRVVVAYVVAGWLVMQVADIVLDAIVAPDWVMQVFLLALALGLPIALIVSWAYELTPEGLKLQSEIDLSQSITSDTGRKLDLITIGLLVAVVLLVGVERTIFPRQGSDETTPGNGEAVVEKSVAVLAFEDLSADGDQAYFAEGLSEELLNVLAQVSGLKVAGRTSSFAFRGKDKDLRQIGELLNVTHIVEGSIRKSGNRIRITAQLINAKDGFHLYSETYDRELSDIFALQDEIARSISAAMLSEIIGKDAVVTTTRTDTETYELYLLARQRIHSRDPGAMREAIAMLDRALEIDPIYAPALAQKALVNYLMSDALGAYGDTPAAEATPAAMRTIDQAIALDGQLAEAHAVRGLLLSFLNQEEKAIVELRLALQINPTMSDAATWLASSLISVSRRREAREILEDVVKRDPTFGPAFNNLISNYVRDVDNDRADALVTRVARIVGDNDEIHMARGIISVMGGRNADAVRDLRKSYDANPNATITQMWYGFALLGLADYETIMQVGLPEHRMLALDALGRADEAIDVLEDFDIEASYPPRVLTDIGHVFNSNNSSQAFIDYVLEQYGSLDTLLEAHSLRPVWGSGYAGELAYAYLQVGDEQMFSKLLELMQAELDTEAAEGARNWVVLYDEAKYAALIGDVEGTLSAIQVALDGGFRQAGGFDSPIFSNLKDEPKFDELVASLADLVDAERGKLGLPPYQPVSLVDKSKKGSVWQP